MKTIRIFISSPGDVAEEREKAKQVIASLQRYYNDEITLLPVLWEDLAIPATASFQEGIELVLSERCRIDIAVFILWSRLGSPLGPAIQKPDGSPYRSGTEREFDLMLAAFDQSQGKNPVILAYTRDDTEGFNTRLDARQHGDDALEELVRQRKLVKQFIIERFQDKDGRNLRAYHSYREPVGFAQRLHVHLRGAIDNLLRLDPSTITWSGAPYRSLRAFDIRHAAIFCGRDEETCDLLQRLRDQEKSACAFVCIVGASGSGKSSLARAGVAASLIQRSFDEGVKEWKVAVLLPRLASGNLFSALAQSLGEQLPELRAGVGSLDRFAKCLESQNREAVDILFDTAHATAAQKLGGPLRLLLLLDQMEELWTDRNVTVEQRENFLQTVEHLAQGGRLSVLATLRSDFYSLAQLSDTFRRMKSERGHFDLTPPGPAALQEIIIQPAHRAGLRFQRDELTGRTLDQRILEDAIRDPTILPLLQYGLTELYLSRDKAQNLLTFDAYETMGGVAGALGQRAAQTLSALDQEAQDALDKMLPLLVSVDVADEQNVTRRTAPLAVLTTTPARQRLTNALVDEKARFLITDDLEGIPVATLAHDALLRRWERVTKWIDQNRKLLQIRSRIEQYESMWEKSGRDDSCLLPRGIPLRDGQSLLDATVQVLDKNSAAFVVASISLHEKERKRIFWQRVLATSVAALILLGAGLSGNLWVSKWRRDQELKKWRQELAMNLAHPRPNFFSIDLACREILQLDRYDSAALKNHAIAMLAQSKFEQFKQAIQQWEEKVRPRESKIDDLCGDAAHQQGKESEAIVFWNKYLSDSKIDLAERKATWRKSASANEKLERWNEARNIYSNWILQEDGAEARVARAKTNEALRDWSAMQKDLRRASEFDPKSVASFKGLNDLRTLKDWDETVRKSPDDSAAWLGRALQLCREDRFPAALSDLETARRIDPDSVRLKLEEAHVLWQLEKPIPEEQEIAVSPQWTRKKETDANTATHRLLEAIGQNDWEISQKPTLESFLSRGELLARLGQHALAVRDFTSALALQSDSTAALTRRAASYRALGQNAFAEDDLSQAKQLENNP